VRLNTGGTQCRGYLITRLFGLMVLWGGNGWW
jgi:hypothetical protein